MCKNLNGSNLPLVLCWFLLVGRPVISNCLSLFYIDFNLIGLWLSVNWEVALLENHWVVSMGIGDLLGCFRGRTDGGGCVDSVGVSVMTGGFDGKWRVSNSSSGISGEMYSLYRVYSSWWYQLHLCKYLRVKSLVTMVLLILWTECKWHLLLNCEIVFSLHINLQYLIGFMVIMFVVLSVLRTMKGCTCED